MNVIVTLVILVTLGFWILSLDAVEHSGEDNIRTNCGSAACTCRYRPTDVEVNCTHVVQSTSETRNSSSVSSSDLCHWPLNTTTL